MNFNQLKKIPLLSKTTIVRWLPFLYFDSINTLVKLIIKEGKFIDFRFSKMTGSVLVHDPVIVQHILKTNQDNYSKKRVLRDLTDFLGEGIFASEGALWEQQSKLLRPCLNEKNIKEYVSTIHSEVTILLSEWETKYQSNDTVNIEKDINILMLKILLKTQFSSKIDINFSQITTCIHSILHANSTVSQHKKRIISKIRKVFFLPPLPTKLHNSSLETLDKIVEEIRETGRKFPEAIGITLETLENAYKQNLISSKQVRDEIMNLLFAGFDTSASALTWAIYCASKYKNENIKLKNEINEVLKNKLPLMNNIAEMPITKQFIQETLRLYPPVWSLLRLSEKEDEIEGYYIPKDYCFFISIYALHRHPDYWDEPEEFKPNRFEDNKILKENSFIYIPFGQGKRTCIGKSLAMSELQLILPMILQKFDFELKDKKEIKAKGDIIIKADRPLIMKLIKNK